VFGARLLLIIRRYVYVYSYTAVGMCHAFMLTGWVVSQKCMTHSASCLFLLQKYVYVTMHGPQNINP